MATEMTAHATEFVLAPTIVLAAAIASAMAIDVVITPDTAAVSAPAIDY